MKPTNIYLDSMKDQDQIRRLDIKTDPDAVKERALWCGIGPGSRVLDVGCVSGKVSSILHDLVQPGGEIIGIDQSEERIKYAIENFGKSGIDFRVMNILESLEGLGKFDFVWVQFFLEFFRTEAFDIVKKLSSLLKSDGFMCLIDLDYNCLNNYKMPEHMESINNKIINRMESNYNFDPYVGRKLYSFLYDLEFRDIKVHLSAHHLIYGEIQPEDTYNWIKKLELAANLSGDIFNEYPGGRDSFFLDYKNFIQDKRRFIYSPLITCKGKNPEI